MLLNKAVLAYVADFSTPLRRIFQFFESGRTRNRDLAVNVVFKERYLPVRVFKTKIRGLGAKLKSLLSA